MTDIDVGIYRTVFQLTSVAIFSTLGLHSVLFPKISSWDAQKNNATIQNAIARAFTTRLSSPLETGAVMNIIISGSIIGIVVAVMRFLVPMTHVALVLGDVVVGAAVYFAVLL